MSTASEANVIDFEERYQRAAHKPSRELRRPGGWFERAGVRGEKRDGELIHPNVFARSDVPARVTEQRSTGGRELVVTKPDPVRGQIDALSSRLEELEFQADLIIKGAEASKRDSKRLRRQLNEISEQIEGSGI